MILGEWRRSEEPDEVHGQIAVGRAELVRYDDALLFVEGAGHEGDEVGVRGLSAEPSDPTVREDRRTPAAPSDVAQDARLGNRFDQAEAEECRRAANANVDGKVCRNGKQGRAGRLLTEDGTTERRELIARGLIPRGCVALDIDVAFVLPGPADDRRLMALCAGRVVEVRPETVLRRKDAAEDRQAGRESLELAGRQVRER